jgi:hypothetical protein
LNSAIQVLIVKRIFIMPDASSGVGYFVPHKPDVIVARIRLNLVHGRASPSHDGRLHAHRITDCQNEKEG